MFPGSGSASTVAEEFEEDKRFILEKVNELACFKKQMQDWLKGSDMESEDFSAIKREIKDNSEILYTNLLSVYGLIVENNTN